MFIRYVGSGYRGSRKDFDSSVRQRLGKGRIIMGASVVLVLILGFLLYTSHIMAPLRGVSIDKWTYNMVRALHEHMISANYNMSRYHDEYYDMSIYKNNDTDRNNMVAVLNSQSNLYEYVNQSEGYLAGIEYSAIDPGYEKIFAVEKNGAGNHSTLVDAHQDGSNAEDSAENASTESDEQESEASTEREAEQSTETAVSDEGIEGYVVPAVAETGISYTLEQLSDFDFLMSKLYTVPARALVYESDLVAEDMLAKDMTMKNDNSKPQILIYHTHSQEGFVDSVAGDDSTTIVAVGAYLAKILSEEYGYNVIHCTEHFDMAGGTLDRSKAYTYAQGTIEQILEDNPSIEVILDIHRDGLPEGADKLVTNIGGKDVAKIMLFNGVSRSSAAGDIDYLYNRYKADNLAFSFQLKLEALKCYPEFTRRNYIDAYQYNLHHRPKSVLVEVGAQNNTLQEELNAMEVFAEVLHRVLN